MEEADEVDEDDDDVGDDASDNEEEEMRRGNGPCGYAWLRRLRTMVSSANEPISYRIRRVGVGGEVLSTKLCCSTVVMM